MCTLLSVFPKLLLRLWLHFLPPSPHTRHHKDLLTILLLALDRQVPHLCRKKELYKKTWEQGCVGSLYTHSPKQSPGYPLLVQIPFQGGAICWEGYA